MLKDNTSIRVNWHKSAIEAFRLGKGSLPGKLVRLWSSLPRGAMEMVQEDGKRQR